MNRTKAIYLDHSATTPADPDVLEAMLPFFSGTFGNASSIHRFGQEAKVALENARSQVAKLLKAEPAEVVFTSGGTESNNWAIKGMVGSAVESKRHIITSRAEHHAVLNTCKHLERSGFNVTCLPVDENGVVSVDEVESATREETALITLMHANNEVGSLNPVKEIGTLARKRGILFHTDAVQSYGKIPIDVNDMNIDLLSLSGHKIYGPKGIGALYIRKGLKIDKMQHGGRHERDRRAGTENVPAAVGLGKAAEICQKRYEQDLADMRNLSTHFLQKIQNEISDVYINAENAVKLPGIVNLSFKGAESDSLLLSLDLQGIAVSNGSACTSGSVEPSHVLHAMGLPAERAGSAIRFSLGRKTTVEELDDTVIALKEVLGRLRRLKKR